MTVAINDTEQSPLFKLISQSKGKRKRCASVVSKIHDQPITCYKELFCLECRCMSVDDLENNPGLLLHFLLFFNLSYQSSLTVIFRSITAIKVTKAIYIFESIGFLTFILHYSNSTHKLTAPQGVI